MLGLIFIIFFIALLPLGLPMVSSYALAFVIPSFLEGSYGMVDIVGWFVKASESTIFVAIVLFIVAGIVMSKGQLTEKIFDVFAYGLGNLRGCIPVVAVLTAIFYGMISGSGIAVVAAVGAMVLPFLTELGYNKLFFGAMLAAAGSLGQLLPPSSAILQYSVMAGTDETVMFRAGAVIGFTCAAALLVVTLLYCRIDVGDEEKIRAYYLSLRKRGFKDIMSTSIWALLSPLIILGGIFSEVLTVVEAAAVSVVYSSVVAVFIYKSLDFKGLWKTFVGSVKNVASMAMMLTVASAFTNLLDVFNGAQIIGDLATSAFSTPNSFILASIVIMTGAMLFLNPIAIIVPIVAPLALQFGLDHIVYGAGMSGIVAIGSLTPPFGMSLFIMAPIIQEDPMKLAKKVFPLWLLMTLIISIFMFFPQLAAWAY